MLFNGSLSTRLKQAGLVALGLILASSISAQSREQRIAERIAPVSEVCVAGQACSPGGADATQLAQNDTGQGDDFDPETVYQENCNVCHASGMAGAPKIDDATAWTSRLEEKGMETIVQNAIEGINAMPPKGMCTTCTPDEIEALVTYMVETAGVETSTE